MGEDDVVINTAEDVVVVTPSPPPPPPPLPPRQQQQQQQDERIHRQPLPSSSSSSSSSGGGGGGGVLLEDETTVLLLEMLSNEIFKDGGASLVTSLKVYIMSSTTPKKFDSYLRKVQSRQQQQQKRSGIGGGGGGHVKVSLMKFLEDHNTIFNVDRNVVPHWVILLNNKYVNIESKDDDANKTTTTTTTNHDNNDNDDSTRNISKEERESILLWERVLYVLRNRQAKLERRNIKYNQKKNNSTTTTTTTISPPPPSTTESSSTSNNPKSNNNLMNQHNTPNNNVSSFWLIKQCQWELHYYLRSIGYYYINKEIYSNPYQVQPVGTKLWQDLVVSKFEDFIRNQIIIHQQKQQHHNDNIDTTTTTSSTNNNNNHHQCCLICDVRDKKIWLSKKIITTEPTPTPVSSSATNDNDDVAATCNVNDAGAGATCSFQQQQDYWNQLEELLTQLIQKDGGHQVSLDLLLHRHTNLKRMLGGRDFWKLYHDHYNHNHNHDFGGDCSKEVLIEEKETEEGKASSLSSSPPSWYIERNDNNRIVIKKLINSHHKKNGLNTPRMDIEDDEGLFSVTNGKWGIAMANILLNSCKKIWIMSMKKENLELEGDHHGCSDDNQEDKNRDHHGDDDDKYNKRRLKLNGVYAIDMTASIGGMTLGLAKTRSFAKIIAIEIDKGRAKLCQQNMIKHGISDIVQVWNDDSVEALSSSNILPVLTANNYNVSPQPPPTDVDVGNNNNPSPPQPPPPPPPLCIVIDPPWGGYEFKQKLRNNKKQQQKSDTSNVKTESSSASSSSCSLRMGSWSLEEVIEQIAIHISSKSCGGVVVGLRLPTTFDLDSFITTLENDDGHYQLDLSISDLRKLSVQLFVVLNIKGKKRKAE